MVVNSKFSTWIFSVNFKDIYKIPKLSTYVQNIFYFFNIFFNLFSLIFTFFLKLFSVDTFNFSLIFFFSDGVVCTRKYFSWVWEFCNLIGWNIMGLEQKLCTKLFGTFFTVFVLSNNLLQIIVINFWFRTEPSVDFKKTNCRRSRRFC